MTHTPVLLREVVSHFGYLSDVRNGYFVDGTLGAAGHSMAIAEKLENRNSKLEFIGIDKDETALELAKKNVAEAGLSERFIFVHDDFHNVKNILSQMDNRQTDKQTTDVTPPNLPLKRGGSVSRLSSVSPSSIRVAGALLDLGISSMQIDSDERGFSFAHPEAPLDMRMDQTQKLSAYDIVNTWPQGRLEELFLKVGEEKFGRQIAKVISRMRKEKPLKTVGDLLTALVSAIPPRVRYDRDKHFATSVFRALRITVNDELFKLDKVMTDFVDVLAPGARFAVITFHSTEDRIVKDTFRTLENPCICPPDLPACVCGRKPIVKILTKKPIEPSEEEVRNNPRARSAKLRVVEKL